MSFQNVNMPRTPFQDALLEVPPSIPFTDYSSDPFLPSIEHNEFLDDISSQKSIGTEDLLDENHPTSHISTLEPLNISFRNTDPSRLSTPDSWFDFIVDGERQLQDPFAIESALGSGPGGERNSSDCREGSLYAGPKPCAGRRDFASEPATPCCHGTHQFQSSQPEHAAVQHQRAASSPPERIPSCPIPQEPLTNEMSDPVFATNIRSNRRESLRRLTIDPSIMSRPSTRAFSPQTNRSVRTSKWKVQTSRSTAGSIATTYRSPDSPRLTRMSPKDRATQSPRVIEIGAAAIIPKFSASPASSKNKQKGALCRGHDDSGGETGKGRLTVPPTKMKEMLDMIRESETRFEDGLEHSRIATQLFEDGLRMLESTTMTLTRLQDEDHGHDLELLQLDQSTETSNGDVHSGLG